MIVNIYYANPNVPFSEDAWKCFTIHREINVNVGDNINVTINGCEYHLLVNGKTVKLDTTGCIIEYDYTCIIRGIAIDKDKLNDEVNDMLKSAGFGA